MPAIFKRLTIILSLILDSFSSTTKSISLPFSNFQAFAFLTAFIYLYSVSSSSIFIRISSIFRLLVPSFFFFIPRFVLFFTRFLIYSFISHIYLPFFFNFSTSNFFFRSLPKILLFAPSSIWISLSICSSQKLSVSPRSPCF